MRLLTGLATALIFFGTFGSGQASAKQCRDSHGKFMKCPAPMAATMPKHCRDAKGKFMKCPPMKKM